MPRERFVRCGFAPERDDAPGRLTLAIDDEPHGVSLRIDRLVRHLVAHLPGHIVDLLEIAAYIYAADAAIPRGGLTGPQMGSGWRRRLFFEIPVREPELWNSDQVQRPLVETLNVLTDDSYRFAFIPHRAPRPQEQYFGFLSDEGFEADGVLLFSGGLDSLAGALEELVGRSNRTVLVSHNSSTKLQRVQADLLKDLKGLAGRSRILHVPVDMKLRIGSNRETTHRSRSFFFAATGIATASMFGLSKLHFFENGVVSINLPPSGQVVGARATRSTHPQVLAGLTRLFSALLGRHTLVDNPYIWKTKTEIIETLHDLGGQGLIRFTRSCAEVRKMTTMHPHCGLCSQCIDRRIAAIAAKMDEEDPAEAYAIDPLEGPRTDVRDREIALGYVRNARAFATISPAEFVRTFGEVQRAIAHLDQPADSATERLYQLHRRHGEAVSRVVEAALSRAVSQGGTPKAELHRDSLVALTGRQVFSGSGLDMPLSPLSLESRALAAAEPSRWVVVLRRERQRVTIEGLGEIRGVTAVVLHDLAGPHLDAVGRGLASGDYPLTNARDLASAWSLGQEGVRKRISKLRQTIRRRAIANGFEPPGDDEIVENLAWKGYRLNPDTVRVQIAASK